MEKLYVIVPYFNFLNSEKINLNLKIFISNLKKHQNIEIVLVEGYNGEEQKLSDFSNEIENS